MRHLRTMLAAMAAVGMMAGCASDVGDESAHLVRVDAGAMMGQQLFMVPELSAVPLTRVELEAQGVDEAEAIPVRVEIFESIAVAWFAPGGEALIGRDMIVALWRVQPIAGEVASDAPYDVTEPPALVESVAFVQDSSNATNEVDPSQVTATPYDAVADRIIDFFDRAGTPDELAIIEELGGYHPGCL